MIDERITRLRALKSELCDIANSYSGKTTGVVAVRLHGAESQISDCLRMLEDGVNSADKMAVMQEWFDKQPIPISSYAKDEMAREFAKKL